MPLELIFNDQLPCDDQDRRIIAYVKTLTDRQDDAGVRRVLSHMTGRSLIRRGVIVALDDTNDPAEQ